MEIITLDEAVRRLGQDVRICLEPVGRLAKAADLSTLWVFNPATGVSGRGDGKFFQVEYVDRGTHGQLAIREEPHAPQDQSIGQVIVQMNAVGQVRVRRAQGLNGEILELMPSSLSKGELADDRKVRRFRGPFESNPQRIIGKVDAVLVTGEFPDSEAMWIDDFIGQSTDARSIAALARLGLLTSDASEYGHESPIRSGDF